MSDLRATATINETSVLDVKVVGTTVQLSIDSALVLRFDPRYAVSIDRLIAALTKLRDMAPHTGDASP